MKILVDIESLVCVHKVQYMIQRSNVIEAVNMFFWGVGLKSP
jgi:hypothetical protein